jgi:excinuclease ABC subunit C
VFIRLDTGPVTPGLSVTFRAEPADRMRYFGPYLGRLRAARGLNRLLPLSYTAPRLGGAEQDLARARGVGVGDRMALTGRLTAILDRQPGAVRWATSQLERVRDRAASALAYEFAARVQAEIEALGWISSPQQVTSMDAANLTISGWSAGTLAQLRLHDGRLRSWSQRPCSLANATPALAATPAAWTDFTQRNAELAASLAHPP